MPQFLTFADRLINHTQVLELFKSSELKPGVRDYWGELTKPQESLTKEDSLYVVNLKTTEATRVQKYASAEERDAEFQRLEGLLNSQLTVVFPTLAVNLNNLTALHFHWKLHTQTLYATFQLGNAEPFDITVTEDLIEQAESLALRIGVIIPPNPLEELKSKRVSSRYDT